MKRRDSKDDGKAFLDGVEMGNMGEGTEGEETPQGDIESGELGANELDERRRSLWDLAGEEAAHVIDFLSIEDIEDRRSLVIIGIAGLLMFVFVGTLFYCVVMKWSVLNALYFTVITLTTVGYGDRVADTDGARLFTCVYILVGVCWIGGASGVVYTYVAEANAEKLNERMKQARQTFRRATEARERVREHVKRGVGSVLGTMVPVSLRSTSAQPGAADTGSGSSGGYSSDVVSGNTANSANLSTSSSDRADDSMSPTSQPSATSESRMLVASDLEGGNNNLGEDGNNDGGENRDGDDDDGFEDQSSGIELAIRELKHKLMLSALLVAALLLIGTVFIKITEGHEYTWADAFYYSVVTVSTVGYGDIVPTTTSAKWFTIFFTITGTVALAQALGNIAQFPIALRQKEHEKRIVEQYGTQLNGHVLNAMLRNKFLHSKNLKQSQEHVTKIEFILTLLHQLGKVDEGDIDFACEIFERLDTDNSGSLDQDDIDLALQSAAARAARAEARSQQPLAKQKLSKNPPAWNNWTAAPTTRSSQGCMSEDMDESLRHSAPAPIPSHSPAAASRDPQRTMHTTVNPLA